MHITTHGNLVTNNWKRLNVQVATLALGLTLAGGAVLSSGLLSNSGADHESAAPSAAVPSISTEFGTLADAADAGLVIPAAPAAAGVVTVPQFSTLAEAAEAMLAEQPISVRAPVVAQFASLADAADASLAASAITDLPVRKVSGADIVAGVISSDLASFTYLDGLESRAAATD